MENANQGPDATRERGEKQLCLNCLAPNSQLANFCHDCGAPLSSFAATGPIESVFAEGHVYRQAVESPRSWIVVVGVWVLFGMMALSGAMPLFAGQETGTPGVIYSLILLPIPLLVLWKTTRRFFESRSAKVDRA